MEKKKYFIDLGTREISQIQAGDNNDFTIYATEEDISQLREWFDQMYDSDHEAFWRAHVPIKPYHDDESNDQYDDGIVHAYKMIYEMGDDKTRAHIESMGILE
ncbi:hydrolase [Aquibacillus sp. 3ASR75-11]|uniref:Hydrolase n=1 Tax=Terrihalobacillus insolitus TaxID=2950438 RepID=A0A9X3WSB1_9BACI|nr:hydrolase [Terrihalobacillus insolitus]MDC3412411.1 hydrolase [Terrihalobacillus insolitus]MDC3422896.1 hydrolase [Terrihalobacillus insolitus]